MHSSVRGSKLYRVHCQPKHDVFLNNGYYETRGYSASDESEPLVALVIRAMLPGQALQPHSHDDDETLHVGYGEMEYFTWENGPGHPRNR